MYDEDDAITLRLDLSNTGGVDGAEVAQLYANPNPNPNPNPDPSPNPNPNEVRGEAITPELLSLAFHMYKRTVDQRLLGRQYLNERFFMMLAEGFRHRLCLIFVRRRAHGSPSPSPSPSR